MAGERQQDSQQGIWSDRVVRTMRAVKRNRGKRLLLSVSVLCPPFSERWGAAGCPCDQLGDTRVFVDRRPSDVFRR